MKKTIIALFVCVLISPHTFGAENSVREKEFFQAVCNGNMEEVEKFVKGGVNINTKYRDGITALHIAVSADSLEMAKYLLENRAQVNGVIPKKAFGLETENTPLSLAWHNPKMRDLLEKNGALGIPGMCVDDGVNVCKGLHKK